MQPASHASTLVELDDVDRTRIHRVLSKTQLALLDKAKNARPLTAAEKVENAEACAPVALDTVADKLVDEVASPVAQAKERGERAYHRGEKVTANPYSQDDMANEWDAWAQGWDEASSRYETDR